MTRKGNYISTVTGKQFYPFDPRVEDIDIEDISHALSNLCRFNGHCDSFYSVAQHSVLVSEMCDPQDALHGLLHGASETYLADIPTPLKILPEFEFYKIVERNLMNIIYDKFELSHEEPSSVKIADKRMLLTEMKNLTKFDFSCYPGLEPYDMKILPWYPAFANARFILRFAELTKNYEF